MSDSNEPGRRRKRKLQPWQRRRRRWLLILMLLASPIGMVAVFRAYLSIQIEARLDAIRAAGFPATAEELDVWYVAVPDDENAALVYAKAIDAIQQFPKEEREKEELLPILGRREEPVPNNEPCSEETLAVIDEFLAMNAEALALAHEAAALTRCRYPIDLTHGPQVDLAHLSQLRQLARLLCLSAMRAAETGDGDRVVDDFSDALAIARSLEQEPLLISQLVRMACDGIVVAGNLMRALNRMSLSDVQCRRLDDALAATDYGDAAVRAWVGERCWFCTIDMFLAPDTSGRDRRKKSVLDEIVPGSRDVAVGLVRASGVGHIDLLYLLDTFEDVVAAAGMPRPEGIRAIRAVEQRLENLPSLLSVGTRMTIPDLCRSLDAFARAEGWLGNARGALAVEQYRLEHGVCPERLSDLVPEYLDAVPTDPFDGEPLRYRQFAGGYKVYSVGRDLVDDGGATPAEQRPPDWVFRVGVEPEPPPRQDNPALTLPMTGGRRLGVKRTRRDGRR